MYNDFTTNRNNGVHATKPKLHLLRFVVYLFTSKTLLIIVVIKVWKKNYVKNAFFKRLQT